jgi:hypothetical protein
VLERWLVEQLIEARDHPDTLDVVTFVGDQSIDDGEVLAYLGHELVRNYVSPGELAAVFDDLGVPDVAAHLRTNTFPTDDRIRRGDFGEALPGALLRRVQRWCVPILKLRYKQQPNQPVQGVDVLAFRLRANPPVVAVPEVKTRTRRQLNVGLEATSSLDAVLERLPSSIMFVVARLAEQGSALASHVGRLLREADLEIQRHIVLVHDDDSWDDRILERLAEAKSDHTRVTVIRLRGLASLVEDAYAAAADDPSRRATSRSAIS